MRYTEGSLKEAFGNESIVSIELEAFMNATLVWQ